MDDAKIPLLEVRYGDVQHQYTEHTKGLSYKEADGLHFSLSRFEVPQPYPRKDACGQVGQQFWNTGNKSWLETDWEPS